MEKRLILITIVCFASVAFIFCVGCTDNKGSDEIFTKVPTLNTTPANVQNSQITTGLDEQTSPVAPAENIQMTEVSAENALSVEISSSSDGSAVGMADRIPDKSQVLDDPCFNFYVHVMPHDGGVIVGACVAK
ncbi:hypothetical protein [Methanogenium organophilum]|uniref:Uncharacterized protein n=1 Tax=Methanogenium organophilum TaxID=2199 RepID=A0A9X9S563_METOG|nr:hypothetical protein [Methanogenium organophilum]WAI01665.1 hypothetical protein OU421_02000 [Methanogenium organophilum]